MGIFDPINRWLAHRFIKDFDDTGSKEVRIRYGMFAGWFSSGVTAVLFRVMDTIPGVAYCSFYITPRFAY